jgi:hypothetical protein
MFTGSSFFWWAVLVITVLAAVAVTALCRRRASGWVRWGLGALLSVLVACGVVVALFAALYLRVDRSAAGLRLGMTRREVQTVLNGFSETRVSIADVPRGFQELIAPNLRSRIFRYDFLIRGLSVHVVYDPRWRLSTWVATYE